MSDTAIAQSLARKPISNLQAKRRRARLVRRSGMPLEFRVLYLLLFGLFIFNFLHMYRKGRIRNRDNFGAMYSESHFSGPNYSTRAPETIPTINHSSNLDSFRDIAKKR